MRILIEDTGERRRPSPGEYWTLVQCLKDRDSLARSVYTHMTDVEAGNATDGTADTAAPLVHVGTEEEL